MKTQLTAHPIRLVLALALLTMALGAPPPGQAGTPPKTIPMALGAGSALTLHGESTLHDFESKTSTMTVTVSCDAGSEPANAAALEALFHGSAIRGAELQVPVLSLKSDKSGLDKNLWKYLKAPEFPSIRFRLAHDVVALGTATADTFRVRAPGTLTIAGVERPDTLEARVYRAGSALRIIGQETLLMSAFGIKPPTMMMGTLRVRDRIVIRYDLSIAPRNDASSASSGRTN